MAELLAYLATVAVGIIGWFLVQHFKRTDKLSVRVGRIEIDFSSHVAVGDERWKNIHESLTRIEDTVNGLTNGRKS